MEGLREKFQKWKGELESKGMKVNIGKTKVTVSGAEDEINTSEIDPYGICGKRVMANSLVCMKCMRWIHGRCAKMRRVTPSLAFLSVLGAWGRRKHVKSP